MCWAIRQHMTLRYAAHLLAQAKLLAGRVVDEEGLMRRRSSSAADLVHWLDCESRPPKRYEGGATCAATGSWTVWTTCPRMWRPGT